MKAQLPALALTLGVLGGAATAGQAAAAAAASAAGAPETGVPECRQIFLAAPPPQALNDAQAAICVERVVASAGRLRRAAARQFAARASRHPDNPWIQLARGLLSWEDRRPEEFDEAPPERAFRAAAALFARRADTRDELRARANLYQLLRDREWRELGDFEVELAKRAAARSRRADLAARADLLEAMSLLDGGRDLDRAARLLDGARTPALQGSWREVDRNTYLNIRGQVHFELGEREEARRAFDELLGKPDLDPLMRGTGLVQRGRVEVEDLADDPDGDGAEAARARALDSARAALRLLPEGSLRVDAFSMIAQLTHGADSLAAFQSCVLAARRAARPNDESYGLGGWRPNRRRQPGP
jgi:tetratricopeptide (TPR) repeat protein